MGGGKEGGNERGNEGEEYCMTGKFTQKIRLSDRVIACVR